jgi:hypothetical protein
MRLAQHQLNNRMLILPPPLSALRVPAALVQARRLLRMSAS